MTRHYLLMAGMVAAAAILPLSASPSQTVAGCGTAAIPKADLGSAPKLTAGIDCFTKAGAVASKAVADRQAALKKIAPAPTPTPTPTPTPLPTPTPTPTPAPVQTAFAYWIPCAAEKATCTVPRQTTVRYGAGTKFVYKTVAASILCDNTVFTDPITGTVKTCSYGSDTAPVTPAPAPTPTPVPTSGVKPMSIGMNVSGSVYYGSERTFANMAEGAGPWKDPTAGWGATAPAKLNSLGYPNVDGQSMALVAPREVWAGGTATITCTWTGAGSLRIDGMTRAGVGASGGSFTVSGFDRTKGSYPSLLIYLNGTNPASPFGNFDCREAGLKTAGRFEAQLVDDLRPFAVLRFLDWSNTNGNPASVTWDNRTTLEHGGSDGVAIESMVDLANAAGTDAWFTVAWNADENYVRKMGELVNARLAPGKRAYFEISNEVWNFAFPVATQALNEGVALSLSTDKYSNNPLMYARKSIWFHKILTDVFKANPARLVRVVSPQADNSWSGRTIMGYADIAQWVDAIAIAPYFGHSFFNAPNDQPAIDTLPALFDRLEANRANAIVKVMENKVTADKYGKRLITYEAGQHIIAPGNASALATAANVAMQRSPLMGQIYKRYLDDWGSKAGDLMTIYSATGGISQYGSWGVREYAGQPLAETPKRQAILDKIAGK